jgi:hypothetical protein
VYGLDDNLVQLLVALVPLAPAQAPANISFAQVTQPVQQAPQRRNTIAHVPTNASYPLVQIPKVPQSLTSYTLTLADSQSPLSKATLTYIIYQHGGQAISLNSASHHIDRLSHSIDFVINGNELSTAELQLIEQYGLETIRQDAFLAYLPESPMREPMLAAYSEGRSVERTRDAVIALASAANTARDARRSATTSARAGDEASPADRAPAQIRGEDLSLSLSRTEPSRSAARQLLVAGSLIAGSVRTISEVEAAENEEIRAVRRRRFE